MYTQGDTGFPEAVTVTQLQLEDVIDQQRKEIEFLKDQLAPNTGNIEEKGDSCQVEKNRE
jgi:hypothetical protein